MGLYDEYYCLTQRPAAEKRDREHRRLLKHAADHQRQQNANLSLRQRLTRGLGAFLRIIKAAHQESPYASTAGRTEITGEPG